MMASHKKRERCTRDEIRRRNYGGIKKGCNVGDAYAEIEE
jgi:hypothetical protein